MANLIANSYPEWSEWFTPSVNTPNEKRELGQITIPPLDDEYRMGLCSGLEIEFKGVEATDGAVFDISTYNNLNQDEVPWSKLLLNLDYAPKDGVYTFAYLFKLTDSVSTGDMINFGIETSNWKAGQYRIRHLFTSRELVYYEPPTVSDYVTSVNGQTGDVTVVAELPDHVVQAEETGVPQNVVSLKDRTTQKIVAPRTTLDAVDGQGKRGQVVGFIDDNKIGAIDDVQVNLPEHLVVAADDAEVVEGEVNINADLLEGHKAEYFAKSDQIINKNLLDNGYFIGGGSQQGGGQFPINQRGETEYTTPGYTVDRWKMNVAGTTLQIKNGEGLSLTADANGDFSQPFEQNQVLVPGEVYTLSVLVKEISGQAAMTVYGCPTAPPLKVGINSLTFSANEYSYLAVIPVYSLAGSITIIAAKLELGSQQTLAHKEGDKWVLSWRSVRGIIFLTSQMPGALCMGSTIWQGLSSQRQFRCALIQPYRCQNLEHPMITHFMMLQEFIQQWRFPAVFLWQLNLVSPAPTAIFLFRVVVGLAQISKKEAFIIWIQATFCFTTSII